MLFPCFFFGSDEWTPTYYSYIRSFKNLTFKKRIEIDNTVWNMCFSALVAIMNVDTEGSCKLFELAIYPLYIVLKISHCVKGLQKETTFVKNTNSRLIISKQNSNWTETLK